MDVVLNDVLKASASSQSRGRLLSNMDYVRSKLLFLGYFIYDAETPLIVAGAGNAEVADFLC